MKETVLHETHTHLGARMVAFAGWEMPVSYSGIIDEVRVVRSSAGLFDVSHMGQVTVQGRGAGEALNRLVTNDVLRLQPGRCLYSAMCYPDGGTVDDLLVYRHGEDDWSLVVNAGRFEDDWQWIREQLPGDLQVEHKYGQASLIALQGPAARRILHRVAPDLPVAVRRNDHFPIDLLGHRCHLSVTGYTGEDGFEISCPDAAAAELWQALQDAGEPEGLLPCGLGARDVLRLEAGLCLYGHELSAERSPIAAGIAWVVKLDKGGFVGSEALGRQVNEGVAQRLVGLTMEERAPAREGYEIFCDEVCVGAVTSGTFSPTLQRSIALAYVDAAAAAPGTVLDVDIRGRRHRAAVCGLPFYRPAPV